MRDRVGVLSVHLNGREGPSSGCVEKRSVVGNIGGERQADREGLRGPSQPHTCGSAPLCWAGHPPLGAQAAAEEQEGHPRDLQCPPARGLERLPAKVCRVRAPSSLGGERPAPVGRGPGPCGRGLSCLPALPSCPALGGTHTNQYSPRSISSCPASRARASHRAW